jgi:hypothetical protein
MLETVNSQDLDGTLFASVSGMTLADFVVRFSSVATLRIMSFLDFLFDAGTLLSLVDSGESARLLQSIPLPSVLARTTPRERLAKCSCIHLIAIGDGRDWPFSYRMTVSSVTPRRSAVSARESPVLSRRVSNSTE